VAGRALGMPVEAAVTGNGEKVDRRAGVGEVGDGTSGGGVG